MNWFFKKCYKSIFPMLGVVLCTGFLAGCSTDKNRSANEAAAHVKDSKDPEEDSASQTLTGRIVIEGNTLHFDEVEVVFREDTERIEELGLEEQRDYPSGYAIINPEIQEVTYSLTDETTYTFTDLEMYFVTEEEGKRLYTTKNKDEFLKHLGSLNSYTLEEQRIVYYVEVKDGEVINITEDFAFTI